MRLPVIISCTLPAALLCICIGFILMLYSIIQGLWVFLIGLAWGSACILTSLSIFSEMD